MVRFLVAAVLAMPVLHAPAARPSPAMPPVSIPAEPTTWQIDVSHSELTFRIRHFVSKVRGRFDKWSGTIVADPNNLAGGSVEVSIDAATINTNNERRDADLRSANFFETDKYPTITFKSTKVEQSGSELTITGDLTIKGVTKPVVLTGTFSGTTKDARGAERVGFEATATINRLEWGITWNRVAEGGGAMLGDEVEIDISLGAVRRPTPAAGTSN